MKTGNNTDQQVIRVIVIEGCVNLVVLIAKAIVGFSTGSLAILGDANHSLTDVANNIVAFIVLRLSHIPADREHPYGHRKFETIAVFGLASLLVVLAFELASNAIQQEETTVISGAWELSVMAGVLAINIGLSTWERWWAKRLNSDILLADASHTFADVLTTIVIILGWQLSTMGFPWLDRICALAVAGLVLYLAYGLFKRAMPVLVDRYAIEPEILAREVLSIMGVKSVNRVRSRWIGSSKSVDLIITVSPSLSTQHSHQITQEIEALIQRRFNVSDITIHVEPDEALTKHPFNH